MIELDEPCLILGTRHYLDGIMPLSTFLHLVAVFKSFLIEVLWESWEADIPPASPKHDVSDDHAVSQTALSTENSKTQILHDLNENLLKQVKGLRSDKDNLAKKVAELEEQLNAVSNKLRLVNTLGILLCIVFHYNLLLLDLS